MVFGDCAVNPNPNAEDLAQIAIASGDTAAAFGVDPPRVALLSYSTGSSGSGDEVEKVPHFAVSPLSPPGHRCSRQFCAPHPRVGPSLRSRFIAHSIIPATTAEVPIYYAAVLSQFQSGVVLWEQPSCLSASRQTRSSDCALSVGT